MIWQLLAGLLIVVLITVATGYFVAQEFGYMAVDRTRLQGLAAEGDRKAKRALTITSRTSFMLSGAQLGITVTGLLVGFVAEPMIGRSLASLLQISSVPVGLTVAVSAVAALFISTVVQMVAGEIVPKNYAIARAMPTARSLAGSTSVYLRLFGPLISFFDASANVVLKLLRIKPVHDVEYSASATDLRHIVAISQEAGDLPADLAVLVDRILEFPEQHVDHAMVPRARVSVVHADDTVAELLELMTSHHSRYPVLAEDTEEILGVVHLRDLLDMSFVETASVTTVMRPALVLPTSMPLPQALTELRSTHNQLACVVDEYGGLIGVITVEDIAEELVGEIADEHDPAGQALIFRQPDHSWQIAGSAPVDEVERRLRIRLPRGEYETLAGLVIDEAERLPQVHDEFVVPLRARRPGQVLTAKDAHVRIAVLKVANWVPELLRVQVVRSAGGDHE